MSLLNRKTDNPYLDNNRSIRRMTALSLTVVLCALMLGNTCIPAAGPSDSETEGTPAKQLDYQPNLKATIYTTLGPINVELFAQQAPETVAKFKELAEAGTYDDTVFHEMETGSFIVGGQYDPKHEGREAGDLPSNESNNGLSNLSGTLAMIDPSLEPEGITDPGNGTALLFNLADNSGFDFDLETGTAGQTVFGRIVGSKEVVDAIGALGGPENGAIRIIRIVLHEDDSGFEPDPVANSAPTADAGEDFAGNIGEQIPLDASGSSDPDGDELYYTWIKADGTVEEISGDTTSSPTIVSNETGEVTFLVTVTDGRLGLSTDSITINVNSPPVAKAGEDQSVVGGDVVTLDGSASNDPDSDDLTYSWKQIAGPKANLKDADTDSPSFIAPDVSGTQELEFELTVDDGKGATATDTVVIAVTEFNNAPIADAGEDHNVAPGVIVTLDASGSSDWETNDTITYSWQQTAGMIATLSDDTNATPTFTVPDSAGDMTFEVTVTDDDEASDTDTVTLTVITEPKVRLDTNMGEIVMEILLDETPVTGVNFLQYIEDGFYDGTIFHRVVEDFVVQGGGYLPDMVEQEGLRDPIVNEYGDDRSNIRGTVAMAQAGSDPDSATSGFFFNLVDNSAHLDILNGGFTVFARVVEGMDVVDAMAEVALGGDKGETPVEDILLNSATVE